MLSIHCIERQAGTSSTFISASHQAEEKDKLSGHITVIFTTNRSVGKSVRIKRVCFLVDAFSHRLIVTKKRSSYHPISLINFIKSINFYLLFYSNVILLQVFEQFIVIDDRGFCETLCACDLVSIQILISIKHNILSIRSDKII